MKIKCLTRTIVLIGFALTIFNVLYAAEKYSSENSNHRITLDENYLKNKGSDKNTINSVDNTMAPPQL